MLRYKIKSYHQYWHINNLNEQFISHIDIYPAQGPTIASNSRSVPMLLTPGNGSNVSSRRPSTCSIGSYGGLDSRRSSIASIGSPLSTPTFKAARRPSTFAMDNSNSNLLQTLSSGVVSNLKPIEWISFCRIEWI